MLLYDFFHVIAHALRVLSEAIVWNGSDSSHPYSELLRDTIKDKCILADFNSITIKGMLNIPTVYSPSDGRELKIRGPM